MPTTLAGEVGYLLLQGALRNRPATALATHSRVLRVFPTFNLSACTLPGDASVAAALAVGVLGNVRQVCLAPGTGSGVGCRRLDAMVAVCPRSKCKPPLATFPNQQLDAHPSPWSNLASRRIDDARAVQWTLYMGVGSLVEERRKGIFLAAFLLF